MSGIFEEGSAFAWVEAVEDAGDGLLYVGVGAGPDRQPCSADRFHPHPRAPTKVGSRPWQEVLVSLQASR